MSPGACISICTMCLIVNATSHKPTLLAEISTTTRVVTNAISLLTP